ncbi:unnamed protein product, partial [uncultured bacterium]
MKPTLSRQGRDFSFFGCFSALREGIWAEGQ